MKAATVVLAVILAVGVGGCGSAGQQIGAKAIPAAQVFPEDASGVYTFTLNGYGTNLSGAPITIQGTLSQSAWVDGENILKFTGVVNGLCFNTFSGGPTLSVAAHFSYPQGGPESFVFFLNDATTQANILELDSPDFSKHTGTWKAGSEFPPCNLSGAPSGDLTWVAVKQ